MSRRVKSSCQLTALWFPDSRYSAIDYLLPSIIMTLRGCPHAGLYWLLKITLGWSVMMWAYVLISDHHRPRER